MRIDELLNIIITAAYNDAKDKKHEYITPEHILYASLFFDEGKALIENCGGNIEVLKSDLDKYFKENMIEVENEEPLQTVGMQKILNKAAQHVLSAGKNSIKYGDIIIAIYDDEKSFGSYFLKKQGIDRLDILNYITHGVSDDQLNNRMEDNEFEDEEIEEANKSESKDGFIEKFTINLTDKAKRVK